MTTEETRLREAREPKAAWKKWGPYLSERQWGTVREDYSEDGDAWNFFTHDHARSRAYRWGEDGLAGISDDQQRLCFALALWNGKDPILKERLFGLTNSEGNHGEDVKEYYFYLDSTPTHSYMKYLYKYPQAAFPYADLVETNRRRSRNEMEYELLDTGVFNDDRYFDVFVEYAKDGPDDMLVQITAVNRGPEQAELHLLPTLWFRNDWASWIAPSNRAAEQPTLKQIKAAAGASAIEAQHSTLGTYYLYCDGKVPLLVTDNTTNNDRLFPGHPNASPYVKDGINDYVVQGRQTAVNPAPPGDEGLGALSADGGARPVDDRAPAPHQSGPRRPFRAVDCRDLRGPPQGGGRVLPLRDPAVRLPGRSQRDAPGPRRHAVEQAVLLLQRGQLAGGAPLQPPPYRLSFLSELGVVPHGQQGHHLDARQVGVPLVRGLGPGLPHPAALRSWTPTSRSSKCS